jgi:hypothetical protein
LLGACLFFGFVLITLMIPRERQIGPQGPIEDGDAPAFP